MKSPNNGGDRTPVGHLLSPNEASSTGTGFHLIELLVPGVYGSPQTTQAVDKLIGCSPQTDDNVPFAEDNTYTTH